MGSLSQRGQSSDSDSIQLPSPSSVRVQHQAALSFGPLPNLAFNTKSKPASSRLVTQKKTSLGAWNSWARCLTLGYMDISKLLQRPLFSFAAWLYFDSFRRTPGLNWKKSEEAPTWERKQRPPPPSGSGDQSHLCKRMAVATWSLL